MSNKLQFIEQVYCQKNTLIQKKKPSQYSSAEDGVAAVLFFDTKNKVRHADYALSKGCVNNFFARRFNDAEESSSSGITVLK